MKKIVNYLFYTCLFVCVVASGVGANYVHASQLKQLETTQLKDMPEIAPYQNIINKLNKELGANMKIQDDETLTKVKLDKEEMYEKITSTPLAKFETQLRSDYLEAISKNVDNTIETIENDPLMTSSNSIQSKSIVPSQNIIIQPYSVSREITQVRYLANNRGAVDLRSEIFSSSGAAGTYVYSVILDLGDYKYTDRDHFRAYESYYTLSSDSKNCYATYKGSIFNGDGVDLLVYTTVNVTYNAG